jgi:hypothetical protein
MLILPEGVRDMPGKNKDTQARRMARIRKIAEGIFDKAERKAILDLVADYEKLAPKAR